MRRGIELILLAGLMVSGIVAIMFAVRVGVAQIVGGRWFWGGAVAAFSAPVAFSLALYLFERRDAAAMKTSETAR